MAKSEKTRRKKQALAEAKHMAANSDAQKEAKSSRQRASGRTFDGVSRPSNDEYRQRWNEIFGKKNS